LPRTQDFAPLVEIFERVARYRHIGARALRRARTTADDGACARLLKEGIRALDSEVQLLQSVGLLDRKLGTLMLTSVHDGKKVERIPSGEELQRLFANLEIGKEEVTSEAERDWLYGQPMKDDQKKPN
jgi:hypothetical protein